MATAELLFQLKGDPSNVKQVLAQVRSELSQTQKSSDAANKSELSTRQQLAAAQSLQRQRSVALLAQWRQQERAAQHAAAGTKPLGEALRGITQAITTLQGPLGGVASRVTSLGGIFGQLSTSVGSAGGAIAKIAGPIGIVVVALGALTIGAGLLVKQLFDLTKQAADFQGRMFDLAQQTGVTVETLSALEIVARTTGGEIGNITQSLVIFQRKLDDAQDPLSKTATQFRDLNIDISDTETALRQSLTALAAMEVGFAQTNAAAELFGARGGKQMLAILKETNGDLDAAIKRFRELGILISEEDARAADKLNDELAILSFQLRAMTAVIAKDLIPAVTEIARSFGDLVTAARPVLSIFGTIAGTTARTLASAFRGLRIVIAAVTGDYIALAKAAKEANEAIKAPPIPAQTTEGPRPTPLTAGIGPDVIAQADAVVAAAKRAAHKTNQALEEGFEKGRLARDDQVRDIIASNKKVLDAEREKTKELIKQKDEEVKALRERQDLGETEKQKQIQDAFDAAEKLRQAFLDKEAADEVEARALRARVAKERADSRRSQMANETDQLLGEFDRQIKEIGEAIKRGATVESEGLTIIEQLEQEKINARRKSLEDQKAIGFLTIQAQEDLNTEIQKLHQEADRLQDEQRQRRLEIEREGAERTRDILISNINALLEIERTHGEARIATLLALAAARVKTEEDAAKEILRVRLQLIDSEIEASKAKLTATSSIADVGERTKAEADLNNQIKILNAQRTVIQQQGNRDIDDARDRDIESEKRYAERLKRIRGDVRSIELESAREAIGLMVVGFARRRDIIRAQTNLLLKEADERHRRFAEDIAEEKQENDERIRVLDKLIEALKKAGKEASEEYKKAIDERIKALEIQKVLNDKEIAELERLRREKKRIKDEGKKDEEKSTPTGRIKIDVTDLKEFARVIEDSIVPLGELLTRTFLQVADAIGQTVQNWVLLGETGPAVMRKILAQALASIAAEAAVNAIKELALGFATLFYNPAESVSHFTAAALWASIGGVAAIAGRSVAGDLFKPKKSEERSSSSPRALDTVREVGRNQRPIVIQLPAIQVNPTDRFGEAVTAHWADNFVNGGITRQVVDGDGR